jgi:hypothetical protein
MISGSTTGTESDSPPGVSEFASAGLDAIVECSSSAWCVKQGFVRVEQVLPVNLTVDRSPYVPMPLHPVTDGHRTS